MSDLKVDLTLMELGERDRERFERLYRLVEGGGHSDDNSLRGCTTGTWTPAPRQRLGKSISRCRPWSAEPCSPTCGRMPPDHHAPQAPAPELPGKGPILYRTNP